MTWDDSFNQLPVVVISENLAREYWKDPRAALGRRIRNTPDNPWRTIVGVVGDERDEGLAKPATPIVYWPIVMKQFWNDPVRVQRGVAYVIRTERPKSTTLIKEIQQAVWSVNGSLPVANVRTLTDIMSASMAQTSFALDHARDRGRGRAASRRGRHLRRHRVCGRAADEGDRDPHRARRAGARRHQALRAAGTRCWPAAGSRSGWWRPALATRVMSTLLYGVGALDPLTYAASRWASA